MRISDWSSDVCSSDLSAAAIKSDQPGEPHEARAHYNSAGSIRNFSPISRDPARRSSLHFRASRLCRRREYRGGRFPRSGRAEIGRAHVELQSLMRISYAVLCLKQKKKNQTQNYIPIKLNKAYATS